MYTVIGSNGEMYGPVDLNTLESWCKEGRITSNTNLIDPISGRSFKAQEMLELRAILMDKPPIPPAPPAPPPTAHSLHSPPAIHTHQYSIAVPPYWTPKSKVAAGLLALFLGIFGIHRFYIGHNGVGIAMLLLTLFSPFTCFATLAVTSVWAFVDMILCFTGSLRDSYNQPLT